MPRPWGERIWRGEIRNPLGYYLVLHLGDRISGYIGLQRVLDELHVTTVVVRPEERRRGHARTLVRAALTAHPKTRHVHLEVRPGNIAARKLYESMGFRVTGRRPRYYGDEDALLMTLEL